MMLIKPKVRLLTLFVVCVATLTASAQLASAEYLPERQRLDKSSRSDALQEADVPVLDRLNGPGAYTVRNDMLRHFQTSKTPVTTAGEYTEETTDYDSTAIGKDGWLLRATADGTYVEYYNFAYLEKTSPVDVSKRLSSSELISRGEQFIKNRLDSFIKLQANEKLVPLHTRYQLQGAASEDGKYTEAETVLANEITFGRKVDGVHVVGPGSKIQLIFANTGEVIGFAYDWPTYKAAGKQQTTSRSVIENRMREHGDHNIADSNVVVDRMECGLFDPGIRVRPSSEPVQSACIYMTTKSIKASDTVEGTTGNLTSAMSTAIPAGDDVLPDEYWPAARLMCNGESFCGTSTAPAPKPGTP